MCAPLFIRYSNEKQFCFFLNKCIILVKPAAIQVKRICNTWNACQRGRRNLIQTNICGHWYRYTYPPSNINLYVSIRFNRFVLQYLWYIVYMFRNDTIKLEYVYEIDFNARIYFICFDVCVCVCVRLCGLDSMLTIWQMQYRSSVKIKYNMHNWSTMRTK